jgi:hypothetical protein
MLWVCLDPTLDEVLDSTVGVEEVHTVFTAGAHVDFRADADNAVRGQYEDALVGAVARVLG